MATWTRGHATIAACSCGHRSPPLPPLICRLPTIDRLYPCAPSIDPRGLHGRCSCPLAPGAIAAASQPLEAALHWSTPMATTTPARPSTLPSALPVLAAPTLHIHTNIYFLIFFKNLLPNLIRCKTFYHQNFRWQIRWQTPFCHVKFWWLKRDFSTAT